MLRKILFLVLILAEFCFFLDGEEVCNAVEKAAAGQINVMSLNPKVAGGSRFLGDINGDRVMDPADMVYFITYFYRDGPPPPNMEDADLNEDGNVNVGDLIVLSKWLWFYTW